MAAWFTSAACNPAGAPHRSAPMSVSFIVREIYNASPTERIADELAYIWYSKHSKRAVDALAQERT